eukprot:CAMPEP_0168372608 /NCGR_PEP_ID=MMETSP0228-20121227/8367_1 /TAXON_ID=133427 /ORGANISM="Protoceratium reticulatum, Strain CCCM 535 (=CCMP 1889)" /LENGTH=351 /DNA_ID=CAMNT_0008385517 /DNA_START=35 /DNA_END=1087 /DNA_ORIENTATION=-
MTRRMACFRRTLGLLLLLSPGGVRCQAAEIELFPAGAPGEIRGWPGKEVHIPMVCHDTNNTDIYIYNVSRPTLTPFLVRNGTGGAVVIAPGGGYVFLRGANEGTDVARRLNEMGVSAFVLKYRVPLRPARGGLPWDWAQLQDAQRALGLVRGRAREFGVDPEKIGFIGFSAGGHLSAHVSTSWEQRLYPQVDSFDALSCRPHLTLLIYAWKLLKDNNPSSTELAPEINVSKTTPPVFVVASSEDTEAPPENGLMYFRKLHELAGQAAPGSVHVYPEGQHGFALCQDRLDFADCCEWPLAARRALQDLAMAPGRPPRPGPRAAPRCTSEALSSRLPRLRSRARAGGPRGAGR